MFDARTVMYECCVCGVEDSNMNMHELTEGDNTNAHVETDAKSSPFCFLNPIYRKYCSDLTPDDERSTQTSPSPREIVDRSAFKQALHEETDAMHSETNVFPDNLKPVQHAFYKELSRLISTDILSDDIFASVLYFEYLQDTHVTAVISV